MASKTVDPRWPLGASLLRALPAKDRRNVALLGVSTYATSVTPRSSMSTPLAIRSALERYSTWSFDDQVDLLETMCVVDYGDVEEPDGVGGFQRVEAAFETFHDSLELSLVLGGDNAATWHALRALAGAEISSYGLVTLDAHFDLRDGESNGSPVRQLLEAGLDGRHVVQVGLADFSNSAFYARRARDAGITLMTRDELRHRSVEDAASRAVEIAGAGGRPVYVDVDMDAADRSVAPACPAAAPGGFSADEMRRFVRAITANPQVRALDITEIDVQRDSDDQRTVRLAALLVLEAIAGVRRRPC
ncbi:MAG TPA: arginase family protein [Acidimicrobiales bacterium]